MSQDVYGLIKHEGLIEDAAMATLKTWLPHYLEVVRIQHNHGAIALPKTWGLISEFERWPEQSLPAVIVGSPGIIDEPERDGDGQWSATFRLNVAIEVAAASGRVARRLAQIYSAAVRASIMQRRSLGTDITVVDWVGYSSDVLDVSETRARMVVEDEFAVQLRDIVSDRMGPATDTPPDPVPNALPEITDVDVSVVPAEQS